MAQKKIAMNDEDEQGDKYRAAAMAATGSAQQNDIGMVSRSTKQSASQSATAPFGGDSANVVTLEPDAAQNKGSSKSAAPVLQVVADANTESAAEPQIEHNDIASVLAEGMSRKEVVSKMEAVLTAYSKETDFTVNAEAHSITDGLVFVDNFDAVHFAVLTATDAATNSTRWEFRRMSGSAMASAKFLGQIKTAFFAKGGGDDDAESKEEAASAMEALPLNVDDLKMEPSAEQKERMEIHEALIADEVGTDGLDEAAESFLTAKLVATKAIGSGDTVDGSKLVAALMSDDVLCHKDAAVQRAAMMVLAKYATTHKEAMDGLPQKLDAVAAAAKYPSIARRAKELRQSIAAE